MSSFARKKENISTANSKNQTPRPYGTIPKYKKDKKRNNRKSPPSYKQDLSVLAPYPFFQLALESRPSFLTTLAHKWYLHPKSIKSTSMVNGSPVGFMPRSPSAPTDTAYLSSVKVTAPMTIHNHKHNDHQQDVSSSSSTTSSLTDCGSFSSMESCWSDKDSDTTAKETHYPISSHYYKTTSTLSGLLCENYVQSQLMLMTMTEDETSEEDNDADGCPVTCPSLSPTSTSSSSNSSSESFFLDTLYPEVDTTLNPSPTDCNTPIHVPLSTFRMFRAHDDDDNTSLWNVEDIMNHPYDDDQDEGGKDTALLENSWANWKKAWQGKQWVLSIEQDEKKDDCLPRSPPPPPPSTLKSREPRVNSAHLRMLVAEVNMMRADKIVGPLRPRNYLPKRTDPLPHHFPSPLSFSM